MRYLIRFFCPALVLIGLLALGNVVSSAEEKTATEEEDEILELGGKVYSVHCRACHLPQGKSRIKRLRLADDEWNHGGSLEEIEKVVTGGIEASQMQGFKSKLSPEEITAVSRYVKTFSAKEEN